MIAIIYCDLADDTLWLRLKAGLPANRHDPRDWEYIFMLFNNLKK
jgi:hypothetical protein